VESDRVHSLVSVSVDYFLRQVEAVG
jgi:hypothetical protein